MRTVSIGFPSLVPKLTMWEGTDDEEKFTIKGLNRKPYIKAYGVRYELTSQEAKTAQEMVKTLREWGHL